MKRRLLMLGLLLGCGCSSMNNTDKGVLGGGAIGAGTGAIVGNAVGNTGAGALIGGAVGAVTGGLVGNSVDQAEARAEQRAVQQAAARAVPTPSLEEVVGMAQQQISDMVIINSVRQSPAPYHLASNQIIW